MSSLASLSWGTTVSRCKSSPQVLADDRMAIMEHAYYACKNCSKNLSDLSVWLPSDQFLRRVLALW